MKKANSKLNIGFFTCHVDNDYAYEVCKGVDYAAKKFDVNLIVFPGMYMNAAYDDPMNARFDYQYNSIYYYASKQNLDAIIVAIGSIGSFLSQTNIKEFLSNFDIPILTIEIEVPGYPYLYTEGVTGMRLAVEHLIKDHKCSHIGFVSGRQENADAMERLEIYKQVLIDNNIPVDEDLIAYGDFSEFTVELVGNLLDAHPEIDALVFANDQMASGGYTAIKSRGLEIGRDILVTGYDDSPVSMILDPQLTTVHNQIIDMGYNAVKQTIDLIEIGFTDINTLSSSLVVRSSCGCGECRTRQICAKHEKISSSSELSKIRKFILDHTLENFKESFLHDELEEAFTALLNPILQPVISGKAPESKPVRDMLIKLLEKPLFRLYFSIDRLSYVINEFSIMIQDLIEDEELSNQVAACFSDVMSTLMLRISNTLFMTEREYKNSIWSSMYITRDTLAYSDDEESCFRLIMDKLQNSGFISSYLYIYDDPIRLMPDGSWKIPKTLLLQAANDNGITTFLTGNERIISSSDIFFNAYTPLDRRRTLVITPLFTNNIHYGLFVGEIDIAQFGNIYPNSLQLATSLNFISLMQQQLKAQDQLVQSAEELNQKNQLLNKLSVTDALTGINNRRGFLDSVQRLVNAHENEGKRAMLIFADMDNLKQVNDKFGHSDGDFAIKSIADILTDSLDEDDIVGRIGGDEFVAFTFVERDDKPEKILDRIRRYDDDLNEESGKPYFIDLSLGTSVFTCAPSLNIELVLHSADVALYENKKNKRKNVEKDKQ
ncbi:MAG: GGDEF domain-containing protein [Lachnospiraceae bacterium]|nr:GGDEF domain-containing protein [Lachnospiraceae bacterium]